LQQTHVDKADTSVSSDEDIEAENLSKHSVPWEGSLAEAPKIEVEFLPGSKVRMGRRFAVTEVIFYQEWPIMHPGHRENMCGSHAPWIKGDTSDTASSEAEERRSTEGAKIMKHRRGGISAAEGDLLHSSRKCL